MNQLLPRLEARGPDGEEQVFELSKDRITIGRFQELNDIGLEPDPQQLITRRAHCVVERETEGWWVIDNGSVNKTFVRRAHGIEIVHGRASLEHGDIIQVLGRLTEEGSPIYWELTFLDPLKTQPVAGRSSVAYLEYDWIQAKLFRIEASHREEIKNLRPQEHKLIRYMDQRNRANEGVAVMCAYDELLTAIWGDEINHTETEVNHLIYELRQKLEINSKEPQFLEAVRGLGYRLVTHPTA